jgi:hypothetical protein
MFRSILCVLVLVISSPCFANDLDRMMDAMIQQDKDSMAEAIYYKVPLECRKKYKADLFAKRLRQVPLEPKCRAIWTKVDNGEWPPPKK